MRKLLVDTLCFSALCCASPYAFALNSCSVAATAVAFGAYSPTSATALTSMGSVTVTCGVGIFTSWSVLLDAGSNGTYAARLMKNGGATLQYNLYTDAAHTTVWGDGTGGTGIDSQAAALVAIGGTQYVVYGVIAALQDKPPGTYADLITVTLNYN